MPAFSTARQSFSASGALNGTGQTNSNKQNADGSGSSNNAVYANGQAMQQSVGVTGTVVASLIAHAGNPVVATNINITNIEPNTIEIQYIVKASY
jgi:hypothetical protein